MARAALPCSSISDSPWRLAKAGYLSVDLRINRRGHARLASGKDGLPAYYIRTSHPQAGSSTQNSACGICGLPSLLKSLRVFSCSQVPTRTLDLRTDQCPGFQGESRQEESTPRICLTLKLKSYTLNFETLNAE